LVLDGPAQLRVTPPAKHRDQSRDDQRNNPHRLSQAACHNSLISVKQTVASASGFRQPQWRRMNKFGDGNCRWIQALNPR
jgi:hypothetical protein